MLDSPYRSLTEPIRTLILELREQDPQCFVQLIVGQLSMPTYWEQSLHRNSNVILDLILRDLDRVVITNVAYQIDYREQYLARLERELGENHHNPVELEETAHTDHEEGDTDT